MYAGMCDFYLYTENMYVHVCENLPNQNALYFLPTNS